MSEFSIYTLDPLNKNAQLGDCLLERETREEAISAAREYLREQMLEDFSRSGLSVGTHDKECLIVFEDAAGEHIEPVTIEWEIDSNDLHGFDMRSEHFNQRDYV